MPDRTQPPAAKVSWSYSGDTGPETWGDLCPEFSACKLGTRQSPIDLVDAIEDSSLPAIQFAYTSTPLVVINNEHTIQTPCQPGSSLRVAGCTYDLMQFHFHAPSEHAVAGRFAEGELHLVHEERGKGADSLLVVGVLLVGSRRNEVVQAVWDVAGTPGETREGGPGEAVDPAALLPADRDRYWTYDGSLTTPPCTEGVIWIVFQEQVPWSAAQSCHLLNALRVSSNNRPLQPRHGRRVMFRS